MVDNISKEKHSKIMRSITSKDTKPDIAFIGRKKAIFVHGCFWHVHIGCATSHIPESEFWQQKLKKTKKEMPPL